MKYKVQLTKTIKESMIEDRIKKLRDELSSIYSSRSCLMLRIFPQPPLFYYAAIVSVDQPIVMWSEPIV